MEYGKLLALQSIARKQCVDDLGLLCMCSKMALPPESRPIGIMFSPRYRVHSSLNSP